MLAHHDGFRCYRIGTRQPLLPMGEGARGAKRARDEGLERLVICNPSPASLTFVRSAPSPFGRGKNRKVGSAKRYPSTASHQKLHAQCAGSEQCASPDKGGREVCALKGKLRHSKNA